MAVTNLYLGADRANYATTPRFTRLRPFRLRRPRPGPAGTVSRVGGALGALALYAFAIVVGPFERRLGRTDPRRARADAWTAERRESPPILTRPMRVAIT